MPEPLLSLNDSGKSYSTYKYLLSALGEERRAAYIKQFVKSLEDIQYNYPFYFTSISGLDSLARIKPESGIRLLDGDSNKLTIKCLRKQLKDNRSTIADLVYTLTQAKLKIKQLTGE